MAKFLNSVEDIATRPTDLYKKWRGGPIHVRFEDPAVIGEAGTIRITMSNSSWRGRHTIEDELRQGIEVSANGRPVARLRQADHGVMQQNRVVHLEPILPGWCPPGAFFRLRGLQGSQTLETENHTLIKHPRPHFLTDGRRLTVADGISDEVIVLFAVVLRGLREAL